MTHVPRSCLKCGLKTYNKELCSGCWLARREARAEKIVNLHAMGMTYRAIGEKLGVHRNRAYQIYHYGLRVRYWRDRQAGIDMSDPGYAESVKLVRGDLSDS